MASHESPPGAVAVIGMACLFPGAPDLPSFWRNILAAVDATGPPPPDWGAERYLSAGRAPEERIYTDRGGYLGDLLRFEPKEFGIMPSSVDGGEPDHFLALKVARDALADSGYLGPGHDHTRTGIILGHSPYLHRGSGSVVQHGVILDQTVELLGELVPELGPEERLAVRRRLRARLPPFNVDVAPGLVPNVMTGRIANRLDLKGPNYLIDAACASSLLSVQVAAEELVSGRSDLMLAGGVNGSIPAEATMVFCQLGALSRSSRVRPFDAGADGTLLAEGLGVVVLKRLAEARRDGDRIYAILRGVGQSSDGRGQGLLAPSLEGELLALERAYRESGVDPASVGLFEAHGTGIPLGDRTEVGALGRLLGPRRGPVPDRALGGIKSMIGHSIPAAGIAGLIKAALALHHKLLPPTLCDEVSPSIGIEATPLYVNTRTRPWIHPAGPAGRTPRRAGVNAFGFGGINTHAVLEEVMDREGDEEGGQAAGKPGPRWLPAGPELVLLGAPDRPRLLERIDQVLGAVEAAGEGHRPSLQELAAALAGEPRGTADQRLAVVAESRERLAARLAQARQRLVDPACRELRTRSGIYFGQGARDGKLAFLYPGEGSQYPGMLEDLACRVPSVRSWFDWWEGLYAGERDLRPASVVFPPPTGLGTELRERLERRLHDMDMGSEAVFVASLALGELLERLGIEPDALVGHSTGETSALVAWGVLGSRDRAELGRYIQELNRVYRQLDGEAGIPRGALLAVGAVERGRLLEILGEGAGDVHLAMDNCTHQAVLYGPPARLEELALRLRNEGGICQVLQFDRAYHTALFEPVSRAFRDFYGGLKPRPGRVPLYSCATAEPFPETCDGIVDLAASQWSSRVRFHETVERMYADGVRVFLEVGPSANLVSFVRDILRGRAHHALSLDERPLPGRDPAHRSVPFLRSLGSLHALGFPVDLGWLYRGLALRPLALDRPATPPRVEPRLVNTLPYIRLEGGDAVELRELVGRPAASPPAPSSQGARVAAVPEPRSRPSRRQALLRHLDLMNAFLASQAEVTAKLLGRRERLPAGSVPGRILSRDDRSVEVETTLDPSSHPFLRHHVLAGPVSGEDPELLGLAVVPLTMSLELLAQAARLLARGPALVAIREVRAYNWLALDEETLRVVARARRGAAGDAEGECIQAVLEVEGQPSLEAELVYGPAPGPLPARLGELRAPRPSRWGEVDLYALGGMFHGPLFRSIARVEAWDPGGIDARLAAPSTRGLLAPGAGPAPVLNPVLLDTVGQASAFWVAEQVGTDFNCFPSRVRRIELGSGSATEAPGLGLRGRLRFLEQAEGGSRFLEGDFECAGRTGQVAFRVEGWRDRYFEVPHRFYRVRSRPLQGSLGEDWSAEFGLRGVSVRVVPPFAPGFLEDAGAIWKRLLAAVYLGRTERQAWRALPRDPRLRTAWLLERIALKEVVRAWAFETREVLLYLADVAIDHGDLMDGRAAGYRLPAECGLGRRGPLPALAAAWAGGSAVAAASTGPVGIGAGELVDGARPPSVEDRAALAWLEGQSPARRPDLALRLACAAAAGRALRAGGAGAAPVSFVPPFPAGLEELRLRVAGEDVSVHSRCRGPLVVAVAVA